MGRNHRGSAAFVVLTLAASSVLVGAEQYRRRPTEGPPAAPVKVALKAGGGAYDSAAPGSCTHAPQAAIYNVASEMWSVRQEAEGRSLTLTLWQPKDGSEAMFTLGVNGPKNVQVSTVRGGDVSGSGSVKFQPSGKGGTFTVNAKTKAGDAITGTIECSAFAAHVAEGG